MGTIDADFRGSLGLFSLDARFTIPASGVTGIFGPSGCGKTTILRCLAGLNRFRQGNLSVDGAVWQSETVFLPTHRRPIGYVFQEPRLFPHLSVRDNLLFGFRRAMAADAHLNLERVANLMGIEGFLGRSVHGLSGGEQQRIAIARALLSQPKLLLMDEPLSALDRKSRSDILPYLEALHRTLHLPIVYVTHDFSEIERLADHVILMRAGGKIVASGPLFDLVADITLPIAREPEAGVVLDVRMDGHDETYDISTCNAGGAIFQVPGQLGAIGTHHRLRIRASDVSLVKGQAPTGSTLLNILPATVADITEAGSNQMLVLLHLEGTSAPVRLLSSITRKSWKTLKIQPQDRVFAQVKSMALADPR